MLQNSEFQSKVKSRKNYNFKKIRCEPQTLLSNVRSQATYKPSDVASVNDVQNLHCPMNIIRLSVMSSTDDGIGQLGNINFKTQKRNC